MLQSISFWFRNSRPTALPQSLTPALVALCMAVRRDGFSFWLAITAVLGVVLAHLGMNLFDDYFDYRHKRSDYRQDMVHKGFRARISKCTYLTEGKATTGQLLAAACIFCLLSLAAAAVIYYFRGKLIAVFVLAAGLLGIGYSGAPLRLSYRGLGEAVIALMFGPLAMCGVFYSACGHIYPDILFISIPVGLLVCNIVYVHSILDAAPDREVGKRTLALLLGSRWGMLFGLFVILFVPYMLVGTGVFWGLSPWYLCVFITFPWAVCLFSLMVDYTANPDKKALRRPWMGPMARWEKIEAAGIDWFMLRWYLARNLLTLFCLIIAVVSLAIAV